MMKMIKLNPKSQRQVHSGIRKCSPAIRRLHTKQEPNEQISISLIENLLINAFGYKYEQLELEENINNKHVDIAIHLSGKDTIMCEGKKYSSPKSQLTDKAKKQLYGYCCLHKTEWGILTDGIRWEFYWFPKNKTEKEGQKFAEADFCDLPKKIKKQYCEKFFVFHSAIKEKTRKDYALKQEILSQENIYRLLRSETVLAAIYSQIHQTEKGRTYWQTALREQVEKLFPIKGRKPYQRKKKQNKKQEEK